MTYEPKQGDIIILDFDPGTGHEQKGRRPCLVVSNDRFHSRTNKLAMVCPITNTVSGFPLHLPLDGTMETKGEIMCEQAKCLDTVARNAQYKESVGYDLLDEAIDIICSMVE